MPERWMTAILIKGLWEFHDYLVTVDKCTWCSIFRPLT